MRVAHLTVGNATWNLRVNFTVNNCELCVCVSVQVSKLV